MSAFLSFGTRSEPAARAVAEPRPDSRHPQAAEIRQKLALCDPGRACDRARAVLAGARVLSGVPARARAGRRFTRRVPRHRPLLTTDGSELVLNEAALRYADGLGRRVDLAGSLLEWTRAALGKMLTGWGHQTAWTKRSAAGALLVVGFSRVCRCEYGHGELSGSTGTTAT
jgi:hypothetical protein